MQPVSELVADLGSKDTFLQQVDSSDAQFWITLEPINGVGPLFPETVTIFWSKYQKKVNPLLKSFITSYLYSQFHSICVNIVAKLNQFSFPTILVQDRKRVNFAR